MPLSMLNWTENTVRVEMFQMEAGIAPVNPLSPRSISLKLSSCPSDGGISPDSSLLP